MKSIVFAVVALSALVAVTAWPCLSCASHTCTDGWVRKTSPPPANSESHHTARTHVQCFH
jgi:hypothetical protein